MLRPSISGAAGLLLMSFAALPAQAQQYGTVNETVVTEEDADGNVIKRTVTKTTLTPTLIEEGEAATVTSTVIDDDAVNDLISKWVQDNPDIIIEALNKHMEDMRAAEAQAQQQNALQVVDAVYSDPGMPFKGNPDAEKTLIKFMDYRCGYCKRMVPALDEILEEDNNVKIYFMEIPILGPDSELASRASLAVWLNFQDKYGAFHDELYRISPQINKAAIADAAKKVGLDAMKVASLMNSEAVNEQLAKNRAIQAQAGVSGTPFFIVGRDIVLPGAVDKATLENALDEAQY